MSSIQPHDMHVISLQTLINMYMYVYFKIANVYPYLRIFALNAVIGLVKSAQEVVTGRVHYWPWRMLSGSDRLRWMIWSKWSKTTRERTTNWCLETPDMVSMTQWILKCVVVLMKFILFHRIDTFVWING